MPHCTMSLISTPS